MVSNEYQLMFNIRYECKAEQAGADFVYFFIFFIHGSLGEHKNHCVYESESIYLLYKVTEMYM